MKLLVIDDDPDTLEMLKETLGAPGHDVRTAANGIEGLRAYSTDIDVLVCDILMPEMDGLEFIQAILKSHPAARIVAYSGGSRFLSSEENLEVARLLGARRILSKEELPSRLLEVVSELGTA